MRKYYVCMPLHKLTLGVTLVNDDICFLKMYFGFLQGAQYVTLLFLCVCILKPSFQGCPRLMMMMNADE